MEKDGPGQPKNKVIKEEGKDNRTGGRGDGAGLDKEVVEDYLKPDMEVSFERRFIRTFFLLASHCQWVIIYLCVLTLFLCLFPGCVARNECWANAWMFCRENGPTSQSTFASGKKYFMFYLSAL